MLVTLIAGKGESGSEQPLAHPQAARLATDSEIVQVELLVVGEGPALLLITSRGSGSSWW